MRQNAFYVNAYVHNVPAVVQNAFYLDVCEHNAFYINTYVNLTLMRTLCMHSYRMHSISMCVNTMPST